MNLIKPDIQRLLKTIHHQRADRVPNFECRIKGRNVAAILGRPAGDDSALLPPQDYLELVQRTHQDAIHIGKRWELGFVHRITSEGKSSYVDGSIKGPQDLQGVSLPDLEPFAQRIQEMAVLTQDSDVGLSCYVGGPFSSAYLAMGLSDFSMALYDDLKFVERLLDLTTEFCCRAMETILRFPVDLVWVLDDLAFCSGPMIRPKLLRQLWLPRIRQVIAPAQDQGLPVILHSDGNLTKLLPMIAEAGFVGLHPIEPCDGAFDIYQLKQEYGQQLCLFGNIDVSGPLSYGEPDEVVAEVKEHIARLADGGGYVVSSSHSIQDSVPPENFAALREAVLAYGI